VGGAPATPWAPLVPLLVPLVASLARAKSRGNTVEFKKSKVSSGKNQNWTD
jgi:hypothetical protein